jgi:serine/threonine-protein kinase HipA
METKVFVYMDLARVPTLVGSLWARNRGDRESASFAYAESWLARSDRFSLEPALKLGQGVFHTAQDKPVSLGDEPSRRPR